MAVYAHGVGVVREKKYVMAHGRFAHPGCCSHTSATVGVNDDFTLPDFARRMPAPKEVRLLFLVRTVDGCTRGQMLSSFGGWQIRIFDFLIICH